MQRDRTLRVLLFVLGLVFASFLAAAMPAKADTAPTDAELLQSAVQEFSAMIKPYVITLPSDTLFYNWNYTTAKQEDVQGYIQTVANGYGSGRQSYSQEGPGLYLAQDPLTSMQYGNNLIVMTLRKGSSLLYFNYDGHMIHGHDTAQIVFPEKSKIREWLTQKGKAANHKPDFKETIDAHWLSDAPGGGELVRSAGVDGFLYDWNYAKAPSDCAQMTSQAVDLINPAIVTEAKVVSAANFLDASLSQVKAMGVQNFFFSKLLDNDYPDGGMDIKSEVLDQEWKDYTSWKHAHILFCQKTLAP